MGVMATAAREAPVLFCAPLFGWPLSGSSWTVYVIRNKNRKKGTKVLICEIKMLVKSVCLRVNMNTTVYYDKNLLPALHMSMPRPVINI